MENNTEKQEPIVEFLSFIIGIIVGIPLSTYVFTVGWNMFCEPIFHFAFGFWQAMGVTSVFRFALSGSGKPDSKKSMLELMLFQITYSLFVLGCFYLINYFKG